MLDRVEDAVRREQRLVANLAHELRTPLANQRIVLEMGIEDTDGGDPMDGERVELLDASRTALEQNLRSQRLIDQLLLLARIEASNDRALDTTEIDLVASVEALVAEPALATVGPKGVRILLTLPSESRVAVKAEPLLLDRLIGNVVENAVRHNIRDGSVWVSVVAAETGRGPEVVVENTGPTVPTEAVPSLSEPLRRGPSATSREATTGQDGIGLGLSVVTAIAGCFGITVDIASRDAGGLTVRLVWPPPPMPGSGL